MVVLVFVTDDGSDEGTGPLLYVAEDPATFLPPNPRGLDWRYFATMQLDDQMFLEERQEVESALMESVSYISQRLVR